MKIVLIFTLFIFCFGCAQRIKVPINRMMSPEAIGHGAELEYKDTGLSLGVLDFSDNSTTNGLQMSTIREEEFYFALGVAEKADLFIKVPKESSSMIGLKIQVLGTPAKAASEGHSLSVSMAMGSERDSFDETFTIDLKSDVTDFALIHGYRTNPITLFYDGISLSNYSFEGKIKGASGLDSNSFEYSAKNIIGAFAGVIFGGHSFKFKLEYAVQKIEWTHTDSKLFQHFGLALSSGW